MVSAVIKNQAWAIISIYPMSRPTWPVFVLVPQGGIMQVRRIKLVLKQGNIRIVVIATNIAVPLRVAKENHGYQTGKNNAIFTPKGSDSIGRGSPAL